jgi:hypothetical protein
MHALGLVDILLARYIYPRWDKYLLRFGVIPGTVSMHPPPALNGRSSEEFLRKAHLELHPRKGAAVAWRTPLKVEQIS